MVTRCTGVDPLAGYLYILAMDANNHSNDHPLDIGSLEHRVEELITACQALTEENNSLRERQDHLVAERAELIEKTELARTRVEAMISRLKSLEPGT